VKEITSLLERMRNDSTERKDATRCKNLLQKHRTTGNKITSEESRSRL
jgi:hypothetical protein